MPATVPTLAAAEEPIIDPALMDENEAVVDQAVTLSVEKESDNGSNGQGPSTLQAAITASDPVPQESTSVDSPAVEALADIASPSPTGESSNNAVAGPSTLVHAASTNAEPPFSVLVQASSSASPDSGTTLVAPSPPHGPWLSREEAEEAIRAYALANNFDVTITHSDVYRHVITMACVKGGKYRCTRGPAHDEVRQRGKRTGKTGCNWRVTIRDENYKPHRYHDKKEKWDYVPMSDLVNIHNHPPILPKDNPKVRHKTITPQVKELIYKEVNKGTPTRKVLEKIQKEFPDCLANMIDVKNLIGRRKKELPTMGL